MLGVKTMFNVNPINDDFIIGYSGLRSHSLYFVSMCQCWCYLRLLEVKWRIYACTITSVNYYAIIFHTPLANCINVDRCVKSVEWFLNLQYCVWKEGKSWKSSLQDNGKKENWVFIAL